MRVNVLHFKHKEMEMLYRDQDFHDRRMPENLRRSYAKACRYLETTESIKALQAINSLNFEPYEEHYSIRINKGWRIEFDYQEEKTLIIFSIYDANNHYKRNFR